MGTQSLARPALLNLLWRREDSLPPAAKLGLHAWMRMDMGAARMWHDEGLSKQDMKQDHEPCWCAEETRSLSTHRLSCEHEIMS